MTDLSRASAPEDGIPRRTILAGAAWSIPVIATAAVAPAASASGTLALAFNQTSYSGTACSTITGAYVTATTNGSPTTGASITVSLSNGYTFAGGSATYTGTSDGSGRVSLPAISVPSIGGTSTLQGISGAATSSATVTGSPAATTIAYWSWGVGGIPSTATIIDVAVATNQAGSYYAWALASDGTLYASTSGSNFTVLATNVTHLAASDGSNVYINTSNKVAYYSWGNVGGIPTTANIIQVATTGSGGSHYAWALASDGTLYWSLNGSTFAVDNTNVTHLDASDGSKVYITSNNKVTYYSWGSVGGIPTTANITDVAVATNQAGGYYAWALASDGTLYASTSGSNFTVLATNVTHLAASDGSNVYINTSNKVSYYSWGNVGGIPATANITKVATTGSGSTHYAWALASDGTLYYSLNGSTFAVDNTNVTHLDASDGSKVYSKTAAC